MNNLFEYFAKSTLSSSAQIMLQVNSVTGLLFLVGIGINSVTMLLGALLAILSSLVTAKLLCYDYISINNGVYGFNAALVGIAVFYLLPFSFIAIFLVVIGAVISVLMMHFMITNMPTIPVLTTPFIISTWMIVLIIDYTGLVTLSKENAVTPMALSFIDSWSFIDLLHGFLRGVGQVMLQDNWLSGAAFCCALLFSSYKVTVWVMSASLISLLVATSLGFSQENAMMGLYGFNGCLVAIALFDRYPNKYLLTLFAILLTVLLSRVLEMVAIPALTAPFVITTWLMIGLVKLKSI